jgi:hypothetical protein
MPIYWSQIAIVKQDNANIMIAYSETLDKPEINRAMQNLCDSALDFGYQIDDRHYPQAIIFETIGTHFMLAMAILLQHMDAN